MAKFKLTRIAAKIAVIYATFGFLWILLSDKLLLFVIQDPETVNRLQTYKGWFYVVVTAILVYVLIDRQLRSQQNSNRRYQRLLRNITDCIYLADSQGNIIDANNATCKKLGYTKNEVLTKSLTDIDSKINLDEWVEFVKTAKTDQNFTLEAYHIRKDGSLFSVEVTACVFDENEHRYCLGVARDTSIRKKAQELLVQSEKMNSLGELAAGMAHEINNPLSAIMGASQNIYNRVFTDSAKNIQAAEECSISIEDVRSYLEKREIKRMLNSISEAGVRASIIVRSMLNFSRKEDKQLCICAVSDLLEETIELVSSDYNLSNEYDFKKIKITRLYEKDMPHICCIGNEIQQVFLNVLKNATEAMTDKAYAAGENPELKLQISSTSSTILIEIEDNGPGMTEEVRSKIFEPFYTLKDVGRGTGLGLSISYFIITDLHHGQMSVSSIPSVGTKFSIELPTVEGGECT